MSQLGAGSVVHRYMDAEKQFRICVDAIKAGARNFYVAVGATGDFLERAHRCWDSLGINMFCIDVANGHSDVCAEAVEAMHKKIPKVNIMAGNVCTLDGALRLRDAGANVIRVGIGPGSMCTTRIVTGHGVPQLTALEECCEVDAYIIADGGIKSSGDIVKALAVGADAVMVGNLLAGTKQTPGEVIQENDRLFKVYAGMASEEGRKNWFGREQTSYVPEGVSTKVPYKGDVNVIMEKLVGGLKVGMAFSNAKNLKELRENAQFVRVTENGIRESKPHGLF
jgi:IMP dehydrogenase